MPADPLSDRLEIRGGGSLMGLCSREERGGRAEAHHDRRDEQRGRAHRKGSSPEGDSDDAARERQK